MAIQQMTIQDLAFREYNHRQFEELGAARVLQRAMEAKPSGNFQYTGRKWAPRDYPGFAVVSMVDANKGNELLPYQLSVLQDELRSRLRPSNAYYMLPPASFHQTVANTFSAGRFREHIVDKGLEPAYPGLVAKAFAGIPPSHIKRPARMHLAGLSIFGTSLGLLGVFEQEEDYDRLIRFRSGFYDDGGLSELGIRRTRPFIGHITLAYIEQDLDNVQREWLAAVVTGMNALIPRKNYSFLLSKTGLRRYDHLAEFRKETGYPEYLL
jgi:hypothetical protein